jgi:glycosyltransferase A (GT-A) superfamily protein (DUF2064 family)
MRDSALLLFTRSPSASDAKMRLREDLPDALVSALHSAFVHDALRLLKEMQSECFLSCAWNASSNELSSLKRLVEGNHFIQKGENFGEKLFHAMQRVRRDSPDLPLTLIGSDCPTLSPSIVREAITNAHQGKLVLGPAPAGGFYLLGIPARAEIRDLTMAFQHDLEIITVRELYRDLPLHLLPLRYDIDRKHDLLTLCAEVSLVPEKSSLEWCPDNTKEIIQTKVMPFLMKNNDGYSETSPPTPSR